MTDDEREREVQRLKAELAELKAERVQLLEEMVHLAARMPEIRREFGNPFYYSHPEEPDEGVANYTANASAEIGLPTIWALKRIERELARIRAELRRAEDNNAPD